ncbi:MAG: hypothetical protein HUU21_32080, partial [Polyangiaceae bacterium]|nr:hypothetical protein [Polyangiaceae bacterium]
SIYQVWKLPAVSGGSPTPPTILGTLPGGAAVGSVVSLPSLARAVEAIRRLVAIGALDGALIGGIGSLGGGPSIALPELQRPTSLSVQTPSGSGPQGTAQSSNGAAASASFKPFTPGNFRHNLAQLTGGVPSGAQGHHVLPQAFEPKFRVAGINIHDPKFGTWWNQSAHLKNAAQYNAKWEKFLSTNPPPSQEGILQFARTIAGEYGLTIYF